MTRLKKSIVDLLKNSLFESREKAAQRYLENAVTIEELERRQRELSKLGL
jgi:hypothetical protein